MKDIAVKNYRSEGFIRTYQKLVKDTVIPYQHEVLFDRIPDVERSHVGANFINAGRALRNEDTGDGFYGMVFQDSDAAKWLEAAAYSLANTPDDALMADCDELISLIENAQDSDGYLNTYYTIKDRDRRWTNLLEGHELYCSGHMMEAAVAYYEATGKDRLLRVMERNMEHIYRRFITEKHPGCPGHPEIELALVKMYHATGNPHCLELSRHFINERGQDPDFFRREYLNRGWNVWGNDGTDPNYQQSGMPVRDMTVATGHAVRAGYLYSAMADLAREDGDAELLSACRRLWDNITRKQMYVTGGIGQTVNGEAFTVDYDLPGDTAYAETCASIALMMFASRMLKTELSAEYADIMELAFYNTVLAGIQLDGKRFFYVNPLEVIPGISGCISTHRHVIPERPGWYTCACCPPNVARTITSFGSYAYSENEDTLFCHLYAAGTITASNGLSISCETGYPYDFTVTYRVNGTGKLALRIPGWSKTYRLLVNGSAYENAPEKGYVTIPVTDGTTVVLTLDQAPRRLHANPLAARLTGKTAIARGPLIYCFEGVDNNGHVFDLRISDSAPVKPGPVNPVLNAVPLTVNALRMEAFPELYRSDEPVFTSCTATAVPYYTWGNRGLNEMRVWMDTAE